MAETRGNGRDGHDVLPRDYARPALDKQRHRPRRSFYCSFSVPAALDEVRRHGHVLTLGRYVGAEPQADDGEPFEAKMTRLVAVLRAQQAEGARLDAAIAESLHRLGFGNDGKGRKPP